MKEPPAPHATTIRNFCVIAHIDHGKSTLADRMLQLTHTVADRDFRDQVLDAMDLERERGITIKSHPVTMRYTARDKRTYLFNLIDTPGHVDFSYEVSRSMAACEGAVLVVDAAQGVEAQTVANIYLAAERGLVIIPVLNKVDLPNADPESARRQVADLLGFDGPDCIAVSAKTGQGVVEVMEAVVKRVPSPARDRHAAEGCRALVFDSVYDRFRGVVVDVRVFEGALQAGDRIRMMSTGRDSEVKEVGIFVPRPQPVARLETGQVGYLVGTLKEPSEVRIGDTLTLARQPAREPLPGFRTVHPMVFCGLYPVNAEDHEKFRQSLEKLQLNDSALVFHPETSVALGFGFRCGFLGLLHMEVVQERLRREFDVDILGTHPSVVYNVHLQDGRVVEIDSPSELPDAARIQSILEPMIRARIICFGEHIGDVMKLVMDRRGDVTATESIDAHRVMMTCSLPLNEVVTDFHDNLKSVSRGYASMDYDHAGHREADIVRLEILLNGEPVDAFSSLVHRSRAAARGRQICVALKETIPPHMFAVPVQASVNRNIIARETIRALRKDVTAKLYGGDVTRKRKLLEKQKAGKKRMKQFGKVSVPQKAFVSILKSET